MKKITTFMVLLTFTMSMQAASWLSGEYDPASGGRVSRCSKELQERAGCLAIFTEFSHEGPGKTAAVKGLGFSKQKISKLGNAGKSGKPVLEKKPLPVSTRKERTPSRGSVGSSSRPGSSCSLDARIITSPVTFAAIESCT
jgi:hypothetical protein